MTSSADARLAPSAAIEPLPPALSSMWRLCKLGYQHEPSLMLAAFLLALLSALPDALLALWLKLLGDGILGHRPRLVIAAALGLAVSATATWFLRTVSTRVQRRFRDKVTIALESHVARLQATVATIAHHERPDYLDRLSVLRNQIFVLDHMYMSVFSTCGWILRLGVTVALLMSIHPALALLAVFAVPTVLTSTWRPAVERKAQERGAQSSRLSRHLFTLATTAPPGKEVRVTGIGERLARGRRDAWERWYAPMAVVRWGSAAWHTLAWAVFGVAYVGAVVFVSSFLAASPGNVLLVLAAGSRLSAYIGATVGEIGFLRGIWMDGSQRLAWLEDYAASLVAAADLPAPSTIRNADQARARLVRLSRHDPSRARRRVTHASGRNGRRHRRRERRRQDDAGEAAGEDVRATLGIDFRGRRAAGPDPGRTRGASGWRARSRTSSASSFRPARPSASATCRASTTEPAVDDRRRSRGRRRRRLAAALRARHPARADLARRCRGLIRPVAEARAGTRVHARRPAAPRPRRTHRRARRRNRARALRTLRRRGARNGRTTPGRSGRITVLVSHRFSTVRMADLIVVLDGARLVEVGTHDELMAKGGQYAELYGIQAAAYR